MSSPAVTTPGPGAGPGTLGPQGPGGGPSTYQWIVAWVLLIILGAMASQTVIGHTIIYYSLVLMLVFLLVTQYQFIASAFAPIGKKAPATG